MLIEVACGIMYNKENRIIMGLRPSNKEDADYWEFPGGKREKNETIEECLKREWKEELNLDIEIENEIYNYIMHNKYKCRFFIGVIKNEDSLIIREHSKINYVTKDEIKQMRIFPQDIHVLEYF
jgi:8-oxo-dGTP diphosphatase